MAKQKSKKKKKARGKKKDSRGSDAPGWQGDALEARVLADIAASEMYVADAAGYASDLAIMGNRGTSVAEWHRQVFPALYDSGRATSSTTSTTRGEEDGEECFSCRHGLPCGDVRPCCSCNPNCPAAANWQQELEAGSWSCVPCSADSEVGGAANEDALPSHRGLAEEEAVQGDAGSAGTATGGGSEQGPDGCGPGRIATKVGTPAGELEVIQYLDSVIGIPVDDERAPYAAARADAVAVLLQPDGDGVTRFDALGLQDRDAVLLAVLQRHGVTSRKLQAEAEAEGSDEDALPPGERAVFKRGRAATTLQARARGMRARAVFNARLQEELLQIEREEAEAAEAAEVAVAAVEARAE